MNPQPGCGALAWNGTHFFASDGTAFRPVNLPGMQAQIDNLAARLAKLEGGSGLSPASDYLDATGDPTRQFAVYTGQTKSWRASSSDSWLTVISPTSPTTGDATVVYAVDANATGAPRSGSITISALSLTFAVEQEG